ncbi:sulfate ABC transporter permease subunit [Geobacillus thermocatenulatus]|nr:sulfate ABC transporter permease subunit [Geobacillus thermocatenulatus]ASS98515.1 sulfate ABC transporter [Geobacillus thermocatenulatus]
MSRAVMIASTVVWLLLVLILPFSGVVTAAFSEGTASMVNALTSREATHAFTITGIVTVIVVLFNGIVGTMLAFELARGKRQTKRLSAVLHAIVDLPFSVSPVIAGLMILLIFGPSTMLGTFFGHIGVKIVFALPGMVLATIFVTFPLMVREIAPVLTAIGTTAEEAAATLGAGPVRTFWTVTWPMIRWAVGYGLVLTMARSVGEFGAVLVVSGNIMNQTQTATTLIYQHAVNNEMVAANSIAFVLGMFSACVLLVLEWMKQRKEGKKDAHRSAAVGKAIWIVSSR